MSRASPVELRKSLETANALARAGLRFVCVPILHDSDYEKVTANVQYRLEQIAQQAEREEQP